MLDNKSGPNLVIHPGEVLLEEFMKPLGIGQNALARRLRVPPDRINAIVNRKRGITADTALRLAVAFNTTPEFWINSQAYYDLEVARLKLKDKIKREVLPIVGSIIRLSIPQAILPDVAQPRLLKNSVGWFYKNGIYYELPPSQAGLIQMSFVASPLFPLILLRLRFTLRTETPLRMGGWQAGSHLRGALLQVMNRTTCALSPLPFEQRNRVDPQHTANCPVCWLVLSDEQPGHERRGYALAPTLSQQPVLKKGDTFSFFLTLFGKAIRYFPYFVMAVQEMGHIGVGPGRGRFHLLSIHADHAPLLDGISAREWEVLTLPENVLRSPQHYLNHAEWNSMPMNG